MKKIICQFSVLVLAGLLNQNAIASDSYAPPKVGQIFFFLTEKNTKITREVVETLPDGYIFKDNQNDIYESLLGLVHMNRSAKHSISLEEREKLRDFFPLTIGKKLSFTHFVGPIEKKQSRTVYLEVIRQEELTFQSRKYNTYVVRGKLADEDRFKVDFECRYALELGVCIKSPFQRFIKNNSAATGSGFLELSEIKLKAN